MTVLAATEPQPASTLEAIRDQSSGFLPYYLPRQRCVECRGTGHLPYGEDWQSNGTFIHHAVCEGRGWVTPVLPDQPCPECGGTGKDPLASRLEELGAVLLTRCGPCAGSGRVPLPLLITGDWCPECHVGNGWVNDLARGVLAECPAHDPDAAGLAVLDQPDWLPVLGEDHDGAGVPYPFLLAFGDDILLITDDNPAAEHYVTDAFSSPPEPGGRVVNLAGARWLDEPITEMVCPCAAVGFPQRCECGGSGTHPLSPGSGGLTVVEVPNG